MIRRRAADDSLRVAINLIWLGERAGGVGRYARELIGALLRVRSDLRLDLTVSRDAPADLRAEPWAHDVRWHVVPVRLSGPPMHLAAQFGALPALALARGARLVHGPAQVVPVGVPWLRTIVTLHDLTWLHEGTDWGDAAAIRRVRRQTVLSARRADRVLTGSHASACDLASMLGVEPERVDVAPYGVRAAASAATADDVAALRARHRLGDAPMVLCVAQKRPYKNLAVLIKTLPLLDGAVLVLPGAPTLHEGELRALATRLGVSDRVRFLDWVAEDELEAMYAAASCFALASRAEGFGLPVLEAMVRGVPVACADRSALPEVVGDAALRFDPDDVNAVAGALRTLLHDRARAAELVRRGHERAQLFSWERCAQLTLASYERALGSRARG